MPCRSRETGQDESNPDQGNVQQNIWPLDREQRTLKKRELEPDAGLQTQHERQPDTQQHLQLTRIAFRRARQR